MSYGLTMRAMLMCSSCDQAVEAGPGIRVPEGATGIVDCAQCFKPMMLVTVGVVDREATLGDLTAHGLRRAAGTWWR